MKFTLCISICDCVKQVALDSGFESEEEQKNARERKETHLLGCWVCPLSIAWLQQGTVLEPWFAHL